MLDQLLAHPLVSEEMRLGGPVGVMAIHGGIEAETAEMAREVADATGASIYVVEQPEELSWHLPSIRYDPSHSKRLAAFLGHVRTVVSLHGFGRAHLPRTVLVGGGNDHFRSGMARSLREHTDLRVVDDLDRIPRQLRGRHPANPVNLAPESGVQLEMSASARWDPQRAKVVAAVVAALGL
ncbi:MAG: poly-gamma-glutamate hydrolase family protein [Acidimicrobiia bacterium]|nr:poly-gamma-glutamate hydrolase family protein [Acidimicrobiia bacterium]